MTPAQAVAIADGLRSLAELFQAAAEGSAEGSATIAQLARETGVPASSIRQYIREGQIAVVQTGRKRGHRVERAEFQRWLKSRTVPARHLREAKRQTA